MHARAFSNCMVSSCHYVYSLEVEPSYLITKATMHTCISCKCETWTELECVCPNYP